MGNGAAQMTLLGLRCLACITGLTLSFNVFAENQSKISEDIQIDSNNYGLEREVNRVSGGGFIDTRSEEDKAIDAEVEKRATGGWTPEDVKRQRYNTEEQLKSKSSLLAPVVANQNVRTIDLSPAAEPIIIRTREDFNTIMTFVDSVGNTWPVSWSLPGNSAYKEIDNQSNDKSTSQHIIVLKAIDKYRVTNYTVALKGLDDPIVFILENNNEGETDFKLVFKVPKVGPNTDLDTMNKSVRGNGTQVAQQQIEDISINDLDRFYSVEPEGAQIIPTSQPEIGTVWFYKNQFIVKSRFELVAGYKNIAYGAGGWRIYVLNKPEYELIFVTDNGVVRIGMPVDVVHNFATQISG
jgi:hypothetical protein